MLQNISPSKNSFRELLLWTDWRKSHANQIFPSDESFRWFLRKYEDQLLTKGAVIKLRSRLYIFLNEMDDALIELIKDEASSRKLSFQAVNSSNTLSYSHPSIEAL